MSLLETLGSLLGIGDDQAKLHLDVLSGNDNSHSPKDTKKAKLIEKSKTRTKTIDKSRTKTVDKSTYIDNSVHYNFQLPAVDPLNLPQVVQPLLEAYEQKQITYVTEQHQAEVTNVLTFEQHPQIRSVLTFFENKLTPRDFALVRTGIYIRHLHSTNQREEANRQWKAISNNNSNRDKRVIKLASANYFTTYFRPLFNELAQGGPDPEGRFRRLFDDIIDDMRFAIFVSAEMGVGELVGEVMYKAKRNIHYGVRDDVIYIHAAGASCRTVEAAVEELSATFPKIVLKPISKPGQQLIKASVYYRQNNLAAAT